MLNEFQCLPIYLKGGRAVGCTSCENELLLNIKQTNHSSSLFITVSIYICKDQIELPWTRKLKQFLNSISAWETNRHFGFFFFYLSSLVIHHSHPCFFLDDILFLWFLYSLYFIAKHAYEGHLSIMMWL